MIEDVSLSDDVSDLLAKGWIIIQKDGIIKKVRGLHFGSLEIHYRNGQPWKVTDKNDNLI